MSPLARRTGPGWKGRSGEKRVVVTTVDLSPFQEALLLSPFPAGTRIHKLAMYGRVPDKVGVSMPIVGDRNLGRPASDATLGEVERWLRVQHVESAFVFDTSGKKVWERHSVSLHEH